MTQYPIAPLSLNLDLPLLYPSSRSPPCLSSFLPSYIVQYKTERDTSSPSAPPSSADASPQSAPSRGINPASCTASPGTRGYRPPAACADGSRKRRRRREWLLRLRRAPWCLWVRLGSHILGEGFLVCGKGTETWRDRGARYCELWIS